MRNLERTRALFFAVSAAATAMASFSAVPEASAEDACLLHRPASIERQLRRLSLALRGRVPDYEEYAAVDGLAEIPDSIIDDYIASPEFKTRMRRFHEEHLLANPEGVALRYNGSTLNQNKAETAGSTTDVYNLGSVGRRRAYRGGDGSHVCQDLPQSDASLGYMNGKPVCKDMGPDSSGKNYCLEGWVNVTPYWDSSTKVKVCAFDAQAAETYTKTGNPNPGTYACNAFVANGEPTCGCGPNLAYCFTNGVDDLVWDVMREQFLRLVDDVATGQNSHYTDLLTTKQSHTNGRLDFFRKNLAPGNTFGKTYNEWHKGDAPLASAPKWDDLAWRTETRSSPHAGVLTLPAYTLRFQTNRARANRFRIAFTGQYFVPPSSPDLEGCTDDAKDLKQRCYCRDCHRVLEPLAAHFAVVAEAGSGLLTDFEKILYSQPECNAAILPGVGQAACNRFYAKGLAPDPNDPNKMIDAWRLLPLEYADETIAKNYDAGPEVIAQQVIDDGSFAHATVGYLFSFLVRREMNLDPASEDSEIALQEELAKDFMADDNLPRLAKKIVTLAVFRRMP